VGQHCEQVPDLGIGRVADVVHHERGPHVGVLAAKRRDHRNGRIARILDAEHDLDAWVVLGQEAREVVAQAWIGATQRLEQGHRRQARAFEPRTPRPPATLGSHDRHQAEEGPGRAKREQDQGDDAHAEPSMLWPEGSTGARKIRDHSGKQMPK
jgi:hypothetical protein